MNIHWLQHVEFEGLGCIGPWLEKNGHDVSCSRLWAGDDLPNIGLSSETSAKEEKVDGLIVMGGPMGIYDHEEYPWLPDEKEFIRQVIELDKPVLGICLGAQLIADVLGSNVWKGEQKEIGFFPLETKTREADAIVAATERSEEAIIGRNVSNDWNFPEEFMAFHWHGDTFGIPDGALHLASSAACENQAFVYKDNVLALQFHLETTGESLMALYENCSHEIGKGPFFQTLEKMTVNFPMLGKANALMTDLLDRLFACS